MHPHFLHHSVKNAHGSVTAPLVRSSTFTFPDAETGAGRFAGEEDGGIYSRLGNPTLAALEDALARMEGGDAAVATASGMGAIHATLMSLLAPGARVVVDHCVYGCTHALLDKLRKWGVTVDAVDTWDTDALRDAVAGGVDVVFLESPMNPTLRVADVRAVADATHAAGGVLVVDNTFATPVAQQPLALGADVVVHSLTKAVNGHSDVIAGAVIASAERVAAVREWVKDAGAVMDAGAAWLVLRGLQTLELRVSRMNASAVTVADALERAGARVHHPALASHPDHARATRQMPAGCGVLAVDVGSREAAFAFVNALRVYRNAVSLGGVESLASHPASTTHAVLGEDAQRAAHVTPGLVRLSSGVEPTDLLVEDALRALDAARAVSKSVRLTV